MRIEVDCHISAGLALRGGVIVVIRVIARLVPATLTTRGWTPGGDGGSVRVFLIVEGKNTRLLRKICTELWKISRQSSMLLPE